MAPVVVGWLVDHPFHSLRLDLTPPLLFATKSAQGRSLDLATLGLLINNYMCYIASILEELGAPTSSAGVLTGIEARPEEVAENGSGEELSPVGFVGHSTTETLLYICAEFSF